MPGGTGDVEAYIDAAPKEARPRLRAIRKAVRQAVPQAEESFGYGMPGFRMHGKALLYYGAFKDHCSLFGATSRLRQELKDRLAGYAGGKGTIQFPNDEPIPVDLVADIARHRGQENAVAARTAPAGGNARRRQAGRPATRTTGAKGSRAPPRKSRTSKA